MKAPAADTRTTSPSAAPGRHPQRWLILGVICLAQLTVLIDNTVLSVAIPSLTTELHAYETADVQWMINAYSLVQSGLLLTAGNAADRYGRKKMLVAGLALFGNGLGVAVLRAVLNSRFAALVPTAVGASSLPAALLLRRAERADRARTSAA